ncbi:MAG TPA: GNAT family N-acetyltransferase, partial [Anaerolineaceae bacterium]|nr:GNAT family N-acetyltransferase [Anaerolineaceae bacterium]
GGEAPKIGDRFVMSDLAATIQFMADQEKAAGPDRMAGLAAARAAFYRGDIAARMVAHQKAEGGWLSADDLANFRSRIEPVVRRPWRGKGVASALIAESIRMFREMGMDHTHLSVDADSLTGALRLYQNIGYEVDDTQTSYNLCKPF